MGAAEVLADPAVAGALKGMGVEGAIISVLIGVIVFLVGVISVQYKQANKVYGYRLAERDTLNKALTDSTQAMQSMLTVIAERNEITEDLADVIERQSVSFENASERMKTQYEVISRDNTRMEQAYSAIAESTRNLVGIITDIRNALPYQSNEVRAIIGQAVVGVESKLSHLLTVVEAQKRSR